MSYNMRKLEGRQILGGDGKTMVWVFDGDTEYRASPNSVNYSYFINKDGNKRKTRNNAQYMAMVARGNTSTNFQKRQVTYEGVKFSDEFSTFDKWVSLMEGRVGYMCVDDNNRLWQLDKDLLGDGKLYSPNNVCFLPQSINSRLASLDKVSFSSKKGFFNHIYNNYFDVFEDEVLDAFFNMSKFDFTLSKEPRRTLEEQHIIDEAYKLRNKLSTDLGSIHTWNDLDNPTMSVFFDNGYYKITCTKNNKRVCTEKFTSIYDAILRKIDVKLSILEGVTEKWEGNETWIEWNCESFISKTKDMLVTLRERIMDGDIILKQWVEVEIPYKK